MEATMSLTLNQNDLSHVVAADRDHVWHHLNQHKQYETADPRVFVEGKGLRLWDANGREYLDAGSGDVWTVNLGYGRESIANAVRARSARLLCRRGGEPSGRPVRDEAD
jgi:taurine-pyruvate aminotransferase